MMDVMGWVQVAMTRRYQHITSEMTTMIANQVGGLYWGAAAMNLLYRSPRNPRLRISSDMRATEKKNSSVTRKNAKQTTEAISPISK